jgi:cytochrome c-type biogenesis protein CcmH/NrfG
VLARLVLVEASSADAWDRLGRMLYNTRRYDEAAKAFARAVTLDPTDAAAREHLARARARATASRTGTVSGR